MKKKEREQTARKDVQIVFRLPPTVRSDFQTAGIPSVSEFVASLREMQSWFTGFRVDQIELSIGFGLKDGQITKLFVSFEGQGGCKVILKPRT